MKISKREIALFLAILAVCLSVLFVVLAGIVATDTVAGGSRLV